MTVPTLVLLGGNMCDERLWRDMPRALLARAVHADLSLDDSIPAMAGRTLAATDGMLIPIGLSMGGIVALEMTRQAPARINGLVLSDTNAGADLPERAAARPAQQERVRAGELETLVANELKPAYLAERNRNNQPLRALILQMAVDLGEEVFIRQSEALRTRSDLRGVLDKFVGPVLLTCGAEDRLCPPEWHYAMAARCANAEVEVIDEAGHLLPLEQPDKFAATVLSWLDRHWGTKLG
ncbi:MAG: alpha/beta hydrolase [Sphingomicrobium sp.]